MNTNFSDLQNQQSGRKCSKTCLHLCRPIFVGLLLLLSQTTAFSFSLKSYAIRSLGNIFTNQSTSSSVICSMAKDENQNNNRSPKKKKPKRRFAQAIDPNIAPPPSSSTPKSTSKKQEGVAQMDDSLKNFMRMEADGWSKKQDKVSNKNENAMTMKDFMNQMVEKENRSLGSGRKSPPKPKVRPGNTDTTPTYQEDFAPESQYSNSQKKESKYGERKKVSKSMMRNNMSIEELEAIMLKRWGTNSAQFTADPREYEENNDDSDPGNGESMFFRGKPVLDPWEKEEKKKSKKWKEDKEFYDEDDEGYEFTKSKRQKNNEYGSLIAPKPIGGVGSDKKSSFFSRDQTPQKEKKKERQQPKQTDKPLRKRNPILLDEDGNELFLTVDKALKDAGVDSTTYLSIEREENFEEEDAISFESLGITHPKILENLRAQSLYTPLPVQTQTIAPALSGNDVLLPTHTGSGKTLAFLLPIIQNLLLSAEESSNQGVKVVILAPGRELASQIMTVTREVIEGTGLKALLTIGGTPYQRSVTSMRKNKPDIIVGTPGRIAELVVGQPGERSGKMKLSSLKTVILDEFDALLEYKPHREPTIATLDFIHRYTNRNVQTLLCSATASDIPSETLSQYLRDGYAIASTTGKESGQMVTSSGMSKTVIHGVVHVPHQKVALETLRKVLHTDPAPRQILIFVENARRVDIVVDKLAEMNIIAAPLHGGGGQGANSSSKTDRAEVNKALREGYVGIVVATELAARGIDAPLLTHVINLDLPTDSSHYAHRAGRCGRGAGRPGVVLNFTTNNKERNVPKNKFGDKLGIQMWTVEPRNGKLAILNEDEEEEVQRI